MADHYTVLYILMTFITFTVNQFSSKLSVTKYSSFDSEIRKLFHSNLQTKKLANKKTRKLRFIQK